MSYAIYAESSGYVHLVSDPSRSGVIELFKKDIESLGVNINELENVFAVNGNSEDIELEDEINQMIKEG